jgi:hypothetical protein
MSCGTYTIVGLQCHTWAQAIAGVFGLGACLIGGITIWRTIRQDHGHRTTKFQLSVDRPSIEQPTPNAEDSHSNVAPALLRSVSTSVEVVNMPPSAPPADSDPGVRLQLRQSILRVLWMVPIYAFTAWMSLMQKDAAIYWDLVRECYEAVAIWSFYQFLIAYLGGHLSATDHLRTKHQLPESTRSHAVFGHATVHVESSVGVIHAWPFNRCFRPWGTIDGEFMRRTRFGVIQYPVLRFLCAIVTFALQQRGIYGNGTFALTVGYPYIAFVTNVSQVRSSSHLASI